MIEALKNAIDIIVPHESEKQFYKKTLDKVNDNPHELFENGKYKFGYADSARGDLTLNNTELAKYLFFDLLTESYLQLSRRITSKDLLWSTLSVFLINYDCNHLRRQLDFNVYDNKAIDISIDNASSVFADSEHLVYRLRVHRDEAIGFLHKSKFGELVKILTPDGFEIKELK